MRLLALHWPTLALLAIVAIMICFRNRIVRLLGGDTVVFRDLFIAIVSIGLTYMFATAISESEVRAKYVELGANILTSEPKQKAEDEAPGKECHRLSLDEEELRKWAYTLVGTYSGAYE